MVTRLLGSVVYWTTQPSLEVLPVQEPVVGVLEVENDPVHPVSRIRTTDLRATSTVSHSAICIKRAGIKQNFREFQSQTIFSVSADGH